MLRSPTGRVIGKSTASNSWTNSKYHTNAVSTNVQAPLACGRGQYSFQALTSKASSQADTYDCQTFTECEVALCKVPEGSCTTGKSANQDYECGEQHDVGPKRADGEHDGQYRQCEVIESW